MTSRVIYPLIGCVIPVNPRWKYTVYGVFQVCICYVYINIFRILFHKEPHFSYSVHNHTCVSGLECNYIISWVCGYSGERDYTIRYHPVCLGFSIFSKGKS